MAATALLAVGTGFLVGHGLRTHGSSAGDHVPGGPTSETIAPGSGGPALEAPGGGRRAVLEVSTTSVDAGRIKLGERARVVTTVANRGSARATFAVRALCGCLQVEVYPDVRTLEPGQTAQLRMTLEPRNVIGRVIERVRVIPRNRRQPPRTIAITAHVVSGIKVDLQLPQVIVLGRSARVVATLHGSEDLPPWRPEAVRVRWSSEPETAHPLPFELRTDPPRPDGARSHTLTMQLPVGRDAGRHRASFEFELTLPPSLWPTSETTVAVLPVVRPSTDRLHLGVLDGARGASARLRVLGATPDTRFSLRRARVLDPDAERAHPVFSARVEEDAAGPYVDVRAHLDPAASSGVIRGRLIVDTDRPEAPELRVEVMGVVPFRR